MFLSRFLLLVGLFALLGCQREKLSDEALKNCVDLVHDYAYLRDRLDGQGVSDLFTETGSFSIFGETFRGREAIRNRVNGAVSGPVTRHLVSTVEIQQRGADQAMGVSYVTVYVGPRSESANPMEVEGFAGIGEYHDRFALTNSNCKIQSREFVPVFTYQDD